MKKLYFSFILFFSLFFGANQVLAQTTGIWPDNIYPVLAIKCGGSACHQAGSVRDQFDVTQTADSLHKMLVNVAPLNSAAVASGNFYIKPSDPSKSFLLRKIAACSAGPNALVAFEGGIMPPAGGQLSPAFVDTVFQWILAGAPDTGSISFDTLLLSVCDTISGINNDKLIAASDFSVFPNPFQGLTNISYVLTEKTTVKLEIYSLIGELVATLVDETQTSGSYDIGFNPSSAGLSFGTYLVKLNLNGQQITHKVIQLN